MNTNTEAEILKNEMIQLCDEIEALLYVKKLIAEMLEDEDMLEDVRGSHITLGKEWEDNWNGEWE